MSQRSVADDSARWGRIAPEALADVVLQLKLWQLDAMPELESHGTKIAKLEASVQEFSTQLRAATAAVKAGVWIVGLLWTASVAVLGLWLAAK